MSDIIDQLEILSRSLGSTAGVTAARAAEEIKRLRAELAQRGEPVAWIKDTSLRALQRDEATVLAYPRDYLIRPAVPLYTAPPQRKPLTSAQIRSIEVEVAQSQRHDYPTDAEAFARAIERAHGIGGDE